MGLDIELLNNISVEKIEKIFKYFKTHMCAIDFDICFLSLLIKENKE